MLIGMICLLASGYTAGIAVSLRKYENGRGSKFFFGWAILLFLVGVLADRNSN
jgi:hypothetical protein